MILYGMKYDRVEVRLNEEYVRKLSDLQATYQTSTSEAIRRAIDIAHERESERRRDEALQRILSFEGGEEMPDPQELKRQNEEFFLRSIEESLRRCEADYEPPNTD